MEDNKPAVKDDKEQLTLDSTANFYISVPERIAVYEGNEVAGLIITEVDASGNALMKETLLPQDTRQRIDSGELLLVAEYTLSTFRLIKGTGGG